MRHSILFTLLLLGACTSPSNDSSDSLGRGGSADPATSSETSVRKGLNDRFLDPELNVEKYVEIFEGESREIAVHRDELIAALRIKPGMCVADIGAGTGLFTAPLAEAVGSGGRVMAVDISPGFLKHLRERVANEHLGQVQVVECSARSAELAPNSIDLAVICDTYHHFEYPISTMKSLHDALRPGGRLVVIDFERVEGVTRQWIMDHVRASKEVFRAEIESAGFAFAGEVPLNGLEENYFLQFQRID